MSVRFLRPANLPMIEGRRTTRSARGYRPHTHPTVSIGLVDEGESRVQVGRRRFVLRAGEVVVIPAHLVHACNPAPRAAWSYRMFYLDPGWLGTVCPRAAPWLDSGGVLRGPRARASVEAIEALLLAPPARQRPRRLADLLGQLFAEGAPWPAASGRVGETARFQRVRSALDADPTDVEPLATLARQVGLSRYALTRLFRRHTGLTPHAYRIDRRIQLAREWLKAGRPPADVAAELGFSDQSHLHRAFKARVAATPGEFQA
jgi:AraC-like DNA-binding protein